MLENAIPEHLRKERRCPLNTPPNWTPPFPSYCARFPHKMNDLVLAIIGAQYPTPTLKDTAGISTLKHFMTQCPSPSRPSYWEVTSVIDKRSAFNIAITAYWSSSASFQRWESESGFKPWWESPERETDGNGWFLEVLRPTMDRFETVFSNPASPEGAANMQERISGEMLEHGYWGSVRDRFPVAQDDELKGERIAVGEQAPTTASKRIRVPGHKNLCVIRSGQDWSVTLPAERKLYLDTMHPVLIQGMDFLRDSGRDVGCYAMNLWDVVDGETYESDRERTFGLGYFAELKALEEWSKSHQTHKNIFGGFLVYAKTLDNVLSLRLFHEVYVLEEGRQVFEYVGCHEETGMLNALT